MLGPALLLALLLLATPPHPEAAAQPTTAVDEIVYNHGGPNATNRSLGDVLRERVSVRDFGALGKCGSPDAAPPQPTEATCPDDTAAFLAAFAWATEPHNEITVHVPPGSCEGSSGRQSASRHAAVPDADRCCRQTASTARSTSRPASSC